MIAALLAIAGSLAAQGLTVQSSEKKLVVNASGLTRMTALQFNIAMPKGFSLNVEGCTLDKAAANHMLIVNEFSDGSHMFVIYNMNNDLLSDGTLLTVPLNVSKDAEIGKGRIYTIRTSTADAVSSKQDDVEFDITIEAGISVPKVAESIKADGKYIEGKKIVIYKQGTKYNITGTLTK